MTDQAYYDSYCEESNISVYEYITLKPFIVGTFDYNVYCLNKALEELGAEILKEVKNFLTK